MTNTEALKMLFAFRQSLETITKKQDELLDELIAIRALLLAVLNGWVDADGNRTAEELCLQVQELVERSIAKASPGIQEAAQNAGGTLSGFISGLERPEGPLS